MALFDFVKDIAGIAGAATGVAGMLGLGRDSGSKETRRLAQRQAAITEALADPNSPMFQQARQQAMEQSRTAQLQALRDYMTAQQRQARRFSRQGNVSMYAMNPRRDEAISRQLASMGQNEAARADVAARQQLAGAAQGFGSAAQGMGYASEIGRRQNVARMSGLIGGLERFGELASRLPGTINRTAQTFGFEPPVQSQAMPQQPAPPAQTMQRYTGFR